MNITRETQYKLYKVDKNKDGVSYSEISSIDKNKDNKIDNKEASKIGITNVKDIQEINESILEYYKSDKKSPHDANEIIFPRPDKKKNPIKIDSNEKEKLKFLGLNENQNIINNSLTKVIDYIGIRNSKAYSEIEKNSEYIKDISKRNKVDPLIITAILFDELNHVKPTESLTVSVGIAKTFGMAQLGLGELVKQGFFEKYGFSKQSKENKLPDNIKQIGINFLLNPKNNIETLVKQFKRNQELLGYNSTKIMSNNSYFNSHALAKIINCHNGRYDYAEKIFEYMKNPKLLEILKK